MPRLPFDIQQIYNDMPKNPRYIDISIYRDKYRHSLLGTYHFIDGANVHISYKGQRRTCARCHEIPSKCLGGGLAKDCEEKGGTKVTLREHMEILWKEIGFKPASFTLDNEDNEENDEVEIRDARGFTPSHSNRPKMTEKDRKYLTGLSVRNLPHDISNDQAQTFLESVGLPKDHDKIIIKKMKYSTTVDAEDLTAEICTTIMSNIE